MPRVRECSFARCRRIARERVTLTVLPAPAVVHPSAPRHIRVRSEKAGNGREPRGSREKFESRWSSRQARRPVPAGGDELAAIFAWQRKWRNGKVLAPQSGEGRPRVDRGWRSPYIAAAAGKQALSEIRS